jgi:hypothetical protein
MGDDWLEVRGPFHAKDMERISDKLQKQGQP